MTFERATIRKKPQGHYSAVAEHPRLLCVDPLGHPRHTTDFFTLDPHGAWNLDPDPSGRWTDLTDLLALLARMGYKVVKHQREEVWFATYQAWYGGRSFDPDQAEQAARREDEQ